MNAQETKHPVALVIPGLISLLFALLAGLVRLPWNIPFGADFAMLHGPLMAGGFLGTVIAAERAAALNRPWAWLAVAANGLGAILLLVGAVTSPAVSQGGYALLAVGSAGLVAIFLAILQRETTLFNGIMGLGVLAYFGGNLSLLLGRPVPLAVPLWSAFLVLTIAGERLELNRFLRPRRGSLAVFGLATGLVAAGAVASLFSHLQGDRISGAAFIILGLWLLVNDIARRTVRMGGVTRYTAICLLTGYVWLLISGLSLLGLPGQLAGLQYDATLHALYIGFVLTMIFGHAPIILPALTGLVVDYRGHFYLPLALLHASLLLRIAGDHAGWLDGRRWGGLLNEVALVFFVVVMVLAVRRGLASHSQR